MHPAPDPDQPARAPGRCPCWSTHPPVQMPVALIRGIVGAGAANPTPLTAPLQRLPLAPQPRHPSLSPRPQRRMPPALWPGARPVHVTAAAAALRLQRSLRSPSEADVRAAIRGGAGLPRRLAAAARAERRARASRRTRARRTTLRRTRALARGRSRRLRRLPSARRAAAWAGGPWLCPHRTLEDSLNRLGHQSRWHAGGVVGLGSALSPGVQPSVAASGLVAMARLPRSARSARGRGASDAAPPPPAQQQQQPRAGIPPPPLLLSLQ